LRSKAYFHTYGTPKAIGEKWGSSPVIPMRPGMAVPEMVDSTFLDTHIFRLKLDGSRGLLDVEERIVYNRFGQPARFPHRINWDEVTNFIKPVGARWIDVEVLNKKGIIPNYTYTPVVILDFPERDHTFMEVCYLIRWAWEQQTRSALGMTAPFSYMFGEDIGGCYGLLSPVQRGSIVYLPWKIGTLDWAMDECGLVSDASRFPQKWKEWRDNARELSEELPVIEGFVACKCESKYTPARDVNVKTPDWTKLRWFN